MTRRFRAPMWAVIVVLVLAELTLFGLGTWQVLRLREAHHAERTFRAALAEPPILWDGSLPPDSRAIQYRRVAVTGTWDAEHTMYVAPRVRYDIVGEEVITPLRLPDGSAILVDRGWYPQSVRDQVLPAMLAERDAHVVGLARYVEGEPPARRANSGGWARFDVPTMAQTLPYPVLPWQLIEGTLATGQEDEDPQQQLPIRVFDPYRHSVSHESYIITWYGLAAALLATAVVRLRPGGTGPAPRRAPDVAAPGASSGEQR